MPFDELALSFVCGGDELVGIVSVPRTPAARGVLIVVGGPQYRGGSHRQFTLLARNLAAQGIPAMRFDYRGMGDSSGAARDFGAVSDDLRAAIDQFMAALPELQEVVLWGLCDAASAALFYAGGDARVSGLVLLNPWVRTPGGLAKATLKHYYRDRLLQPALWKKIFSGRFEFRKAAASLLRVVGAVRKGQAQLAAAVPAGHKADAETGTIPAMAALPERMQAGLQQFNGKVLLILSGADLTAQEFLDLVKASRPWQRLLAAPRVTRRDLAQADHTFSRRVWRDQVAGWTGEWMRSW